MAAPPISQYDPEEGWDVYWADEEATFQDMEKTDVLPDDLIDQINQLFDEDE